MRLMDRFIGSLPTAGFGGARLAAVFVLLSLCATTGQAVPEDSIVGVAARLATAEADVYQWRQQSARLAMEGLWQQGFRCGISVTNGAPPLMLCAKDYPQAIDCGTFVWFFKVQWHEESRDPRTLFEELKESTIQQPFPACAGNASVRPWSDLPADTRSRIAERVDAFAATGLNRENFIEKAVELGYLCGRDQAADSPVSSCSKATPKLPGCPRLLVSLQDTGQSPSNGFTTTCLADGY